MLISHLRLTHIAMMAGVSEYTVASWLHGRSQPKAHYVELLRALCPEFRRILDEQSSSIRVDLPLAA